MHDSRILDELEQGDQNKRQLHELHNIQKYVDPFNVGVLCDDQAGEKTDGPRYQNSMVPWDF